MRIFKNGVILRIDDGKAYTCKLSADSYRCPECWHVVYSGYGASVEPHDPGYDLLQEVAHIKW